MWRIVLGLSLLCCSQAFAATPGLPESLERALRSRGLSSQGVSIYAQEIGTVAPLVAVGADEPRHPASVMKVLTTLAALEELGPTYQWKTELWTKAPVKDGRLEGDLYIKGYGDPYLVIEHFWRLLRVLRSQGITSIAGDLVVDQSYFAAEAEEDPGEFDGRANRVYNVLPAALLVNFQAVNFRFIPDGPANRVRIVAEPWPAQLALENNLRLMRGGCHGWASQIAMRNAHKAGLETMVFSGIYDLGCGERELFRVVSTGVPYTHGVFKAVWTEMGGRLEGGVREALVPDDARLVASLSSPPLADVIRSVNKYSNNVMTRQLLLTLGAEKGGAPGTTQKGIAALRAWMKRRDFEFPELVLENGTGLSRRELISARHLAQLLLAGYASPSMPEYLSSFPISGLDGTMRHRLSGTPLEGRVHLKTGMINNVRSIAGYVLDRQNRRVAVVIMHNHAQANSAAADTFQDAVLDWLYRRPPSSSGVAPAQPAP